MKSITQRIFREAIRVQHRRALFACLFLILGSSSTAKSITVDDALTNLRSRLLSCEDSATVWASGTGTMRDIRVTQVFQFDDRGRFVVDVRGPIASLTGFDGTEVWQRDQTGRTRTLQLGDRHRALLSHWLVIGYWVHPEAPVDIGPSDRRVDAGELAISVGLRDTPITGTMIVDVDTWLPKSYVRVDAGFEHEIRFVSWDRSLGRHVSREIEITNGGIVNARFILDTLRAMPTVDPTVYERRADTMQKYYAASGDGPVKNKRGRWGHHFVRPRINGEDIGWLAFDTGARLSIIDDDVAKKLGLELIGDIQAGGVGGLIENKLYRIESIELGPLRIEDIPVIVSPMENISLGLDEGHAGILGMDFLWNCVIDYDQKNSIIGLYNPDTYTLPVGKWNDLLDYNGKPTVKMRFEGHDGLFTIDTGNPGAILVSPLTVERLSLLDGRRTTTGTVGGFGGRVASQDGSLAWVEWGDRRFEDVPANFVTEKRGATADVTRDGIIGTDLLRRYRMIFDIQHGRAAYLPNDPVSE